MLPLALAFRRQTPSTTQFLRRPGCRHYRHRSFRPGAYGRLAAAVNRGEDDSRGEGSGVLEGVEDLKDLHTAMSQAGKDAKTGPGHAPPGYSEPLHPYAMAGHPYPPNAPYANPYAVPHHASPYYAGYPSASYPSAIYPSASYPYAGNPHAVNPYPASPYPPVGPYPVRASPFSPQPVDPQPIDPQPIHRASAQASRKTAAHANPSYNTTSATNTASAGARKTVSAQGTTLSDVPHKITPAILATRAAKRLLQVSTNGQQQEDIMLSEAEQRWSDKLSRHLSQEFVHVAKHLLKVSTAPQALANGEARPLPAQQTYETRRPRENERAGGTTKRGPQSLTEGTTSQEPKAVARPKKRQEPKSNAPTKAKKGGDKGGMEVLSVRPSEVHLTPLVPNTVDAPPLSYGLDRCLFKPGVYPLHDARSKVFNFDPYLSTIMPIHEFDFGALRSFVTSSEDPRLREQAVKHGKKYSGSTSSMSSMLSHLHFLLSAWRPVNFACTSQNYKPESLNYTAITRAPAATYLRFKDGVYSLDADKEFDTANVLTMLGRSMEKLLTLPRNEFEMYSRDQSHLLTDEMRAKDMDIFHYSGIGDFILRSQIDAYDKRLPGSGVFDIKTRAAYSVRMNAKGFLEGQHYEIRDRFGQYESFEREYADMIRAAFLKYSLQVRMGRMDGIFVAYHNTRRMFGFQYIPLEELDLAIHGTTNLALGDQEFRASMQILNELFNRATARFPNQSLRLHVEARPTNPPLIYFFATPVPDKRIDAAQKAAYAQVEKLEAELLGAVGREDQQSEESGPMYDDAGQKTSERETELVSDGLNLSVWAEMNRKVEEAVASDELGIQYVRDSIEGALEQSGLLAGKSAKEVDEWVDKFLQTFLSQEGEGSAGNTPPEEDEVGEEEKDEQEVREDGEGSASEASPATEEVHETEVADRKDSGDATSGSSTGLAEEGQGDSREAAISKDVDGECSSEDQRTGESIEGAHEGAEHQVVEAEARPAVAETLAEKKSEEAVVAGARDADHSTDSSFSGEVEAAGRERDEGERDKATEQETVGATETPDTAETPDMAETAVTGETPDPAGTAEVDTTSTTAVDQDSPTFKELLLRVAEQAEGKPLYPCPEAEEELEGSRDEESGKLQEFERVLTQLLAQSRLDREASDNEKGDDMMEDGVGEGLSGETGARAGEADIKDDESEPSELLGLIVTVGNKVNGQYTSRPYLDDPADKWQVEYSIQTMEETRARSIHGQLKRRRRVLLSEEERMAHYRSNFIQDRLPRLNQSGSEYRRRLDEELQKRPIYVYGEDQPREYSALFDVEKAKTAETVQNAETIKKAEPAETTKTAETAETAKEE